MTQEFYVGDKAYLEISLGAFCEVEVIKVNYAYGKVRYTVVPVTGKGEIKTEKLAGISRKANRKDEIGQGKRT